MKPVYVSLKELKTAQHTKSTSSSSSCFDDERLADGGKRKRRNWDLRIAIVCISVVMIALVGFSAVLIASNVVCRPPVYIRTFARCTQNGTSAKFVFLYVPMTAAHVQKLIGAESSVESQGSCDSTCPESVVAVQFNDDDLTPKMICCPSEFVITNVKCMSEYAFYIFVRPSISFDFLLGQLPSSARCFKTHDIAVANYSLTEVITVPRSNLKRLL